MPDIKQFQPKVISLQNNTAALLSLLGGDDDDQLRFWEILKGITTPAVFHLVERELDMMASMLETVQDSVRVLEGVAQELQV